jgi:DNA processing protein
MDTPPIDAETRALLAMHLVPGLGPRLTQALLEKFGSAQQALLASADELKTIRYIGAQTAQDLVTALRSANIEKEVELLERHAVRLLRLGAPDYPVALATIFDPPQILYVRGEIKPEDKNAVAIVGSRQCTRYGVKVAERLASDLARRGFTVVSGLARGIDAAAHRGALAAGGQTHAVLAGGLAKIYPPEHGELADQVCAAGALLSEAPMAMAALRDMFPARNRLISGLCRGVVIVEAAVKSGALITARHAAEQSRDVFAVPGPIDSEASGGTLQLIKDGAVLVRNVDDILAAWNDVPAPSRTEPTPIGETQPRSPPVPLTPPQRQLWELLAEPLHADQLVQRSNLPVADVGTALIMMEMQGVVRRLPGNRFERK